MNYGADSKLTSQDRSDLKKLYRLAWSGELTEINGTSIKFVKPFHLSGNPVRAVAAAQPVQPLADVPPNWMRAE
jgi:adenylylsulfate kinase-like enzyme